MTADADLTRLESVWRQRAKNNAQLGVANPQDVLTQSYYCCLMAVEGDAMKIYAVTFYVKADDMTPATPENTRTMAVKAGSEWNAQERMRARLCDEYPSGIGGSKAVILRVEAQA